jgi:hypothetical protein
MLLLITRRRIIRILLVSAILAILVPASIFIFHRFNDSSSDSSQLEDGSQLEDAAADTVVSEIFQRRYDEATDKYIDAATGVDRFVALSELSALALEQNNLDEALKFSLEASSITELSPDFSYAALLQDIKIYALLNDFDKAKEKLDALRLLEINFNQETINYLNSVEQSISNKEAIPNITPCADYNNEGECV